ncbi:MAG: alpha/beta fold hydrolase, partial [Nocardioidaceae bacterium]
LVELIDYWGLCRPVLVAHDIAPLFALRAHLLEGLDVAGLVLADAAVIPPFVSGFSAHVRDHIGVFRGIPTYIAEAMIEAHMATAVHLPMNAASMEAYMRPWRGEAGVAAHWRAVAAFDENLAAPVVERLHQLTVPTLVLWGTEDQWVPVWKADELIQAAPGMDRVLLPDTGHFSPEETPLGFADAVADFLARNKNQLRLSQHAQ